MWFAESLAGTQIFLILELTDDGDKQVNYLMKLVSGFFNEMQKAGPQEKLYKTIQK